MAEIVEAFKNIVGEANVSTSVLLQILALRKNAPRKDGQEARAFRVACSKRLGNSPAAGCRV
jgi:hypothetical protein